MIICSPQLGISPESTLGGEVYDRELLKHLAWAGHEIEIILPAGQPHEQGIVGWHIHRIPLRRGYRWFVSNLIFPHYIKKVYERKKFDILRVHSLRFVGPAALWFKKRYGLKVPIISHHHHLDPHPLNRLLEKKVIESSERVITGSEFARRQLIDKLGVEQAPIEVVYYGIDRKFKPLPRDEALSRRLGLESKQVLLYLGQLKPRKNLPFLLDVFREIVALKGDTVRLIIAGAGELLNSLRKKACNLGVEKQVVFAGYVPESEKVKYYNLADVFVFPSQLEGFGLAVGEAMSCGKPVIAFNAASLPEVMANGRTGFLVEPNDRNGFAKRIVQVLDDKELRLRLGGAGQRRVDEMFRWERTASRTLRIYDEILNRSGR